MRRELTTGGPSSNLVEGWKAPYGYAGGACPNAMWIGPETATDEDIARLTAHGHKCEDMTLCGTHDIAWHHPCYDFLLDGIDDLEPYETVKKPGGRGSWTYKSQLLPGEADGVSKPRKWLWTEDGSVVRSKGGELFELVDKGEGHIDRHELAGIDIEWDEERQLWLWTNPPMTEDERMAAEYEARLARGKPDEG